MEPFIGRVEQVTSWKARIALAWEALKGEAYTIKEDKRITNA